MAKITIELCSDATGHLSPVVSSLCIDDELVKFIQSIDLCIDIKCDIPRLVVCFPDVKGLGADNMKNTINDYAKRLQKAGVVVRYAPLPEE